MSQCAKCKGPAPMTSGVMWTEGDEEVLEVLCAVCVKRLGEVIQLAISVHPNSLVDSGKPYSGSMAGRATGSGDAKI